MGEAAGILPRADPGQVGMTLGGIFDSAAAHFAIALATRPVLDRLKRRQITNAYRIAAAATIEHAQQEGYPAGSDIWTAVVDLLRTEQRAQQIASWYSLRRVDPTQFQEMQGDAPVVGKFLEYFISRLNQERADLLPLDLQVLADLIGHQTGQQIVKETAAEANITKRIYPTWSATRWPPPFWSGGCLWSRFKSY